MENTGSTGKIKKIIAALVSIIVVAAAAAGIVFAAKKYSQGQEQETSYREYTAANGSITVGVSESGTASVSRNNVTFPASAEIDEVYVKMGSQVSAGDKIAKVSTDDIDAIKADYESQIAAAKLELDTALAEQSTKLLQAQLAYEKSVSEGQSAESLYSLSITKISDDISSAEDTITSLEKQLDEYKALAESYPVDYKQYCDYSDTLDSYNATYKEYQDTYSGYEKTLSGYEKALSNVQEEYDDYLDEHSEELQTVSTLKANIEKTKTELDTAEENLNKQLSKYGPSPDSTGQESVSSAQEAYNEAKKAYDDACQAYANMYQSIDITTQNAIAKYEDKVEAAQEQVDSYKEMMEEYSEKMSDYSKMIEDYKADNEDMLSDFNELYGNMDADDIADKISETEKSIYEAKYNLEKLQADSSGSELSASQNLQTAVAAAENAQTVYNSTVEQINADIANKQDSYDRLAAEYDELLENLGDGIYIYADCAGSVASVNISAGDTIMSGQSIASIADSSEVYVAVSVSEEDISALYVGQTASVVLSAYENVTIEGEIDTIAVEPSRSSGSVTYPVTVKINPSEHITVYDGMTCEVTFLQKQVNDVLYVSKQAVTYKGAGKSSVLVYDENGNVVEKEVITGFTDGQYVEIKSGLSAGDTVLSESAVKR